jgi:integrase
MLIFMDFNDLAGTTFAAVSVGPDDEICGQQFHGLLSWPMTTKLPIALDSHARERAVELDALCAILPFDRRDQLALLLTSDDTATLKHLAKKGMGENTLRALTSDGRLYAGSRVEIIWTSPQVGAFLGQRRYAHMHLPLLIGLWTGQREGDVLRLKWSNYDGQRSG